MRVPSPLMVGGVDGEEEGGGGPCGYMYIRGVGTEACPMERDVGGAILWACVYMCLMPSNYSNMYMLKCTYPLSITYVQCLGLWLSLAHNGGGRGLPQSGM